MGEGNENWTELRHPPTPANTEAREGPFLPAPKLSKKMQKK